MNGDSLDTNHCDSDANDPAETEGLCECANPDNADERPADSRLAERVTFAGEAVLCALAAVAIGVYLWLMPQRIGFPFDFDWCEGALVDTARRLLDGLPLYAPPSLEYTCYAYTPLYYYLCAAAFRLFGTDIPVARFVTFLFFLGTSGMMYLFVRRETGRRAWGFIAVGLFAAMFEKTYGWFDLVRVDFPFLFFLLAALYLARFGKQTIRCGVVIGLLFFLSFFSKQTALPISAVVLVYMALMGWRRAAAAGATLLVLFLVSRLILDRATDGWYSYYTLDSMRQHSRVASLWMGYWRDDLLKVLPVSLLLSLWLLVRLTRQRGRGWTFYPLLLPGTLAVCWASRLHEGSSVNSTLPVYVMLVMLSTLAAHHVVQFLPQHRPRLGAGLCAGVYVLFALQFALLAYNPRQFIPNPADLDAGWKLVDMMREVKGEVLMQDHGFMPVLAGKKCYSNYVSSWDLMRGKNEPLKKQWKDELLQAVRGDKFSVVITDYHVRMADRYIEIPLRPDRLPNWHNGEWGTRPAAIYVRKDAVQDIEVVRKYFPF